MERAPLRPVPSRPPGPIAPAEALGYVTRELPGLDGRAAGALAMVALVGLSRKEIGSASDPEEVAGLSGEDLAEALARGRKALRRRLYPLPGSGWCERAERLISDRLDDALADPGPARLEVHLANCGRCVEHERRLAQSQDALVAGFGEARPAAEPEPESAPPAGQVEAEVEAESPPAPPVLRAVETPILPAAPEPEALPSPDSSQDALSPPEAQPAQLDGESGEPEDQQAQLEGDSAEPEDQQAQLEQPPPRREEPPAVAVPSARRRSSATLWSPAAPPPPRMPLSADPPAPLGVAPPAPPAPLAPAPPAAAPPAPNAWRSQAPRPPLAALRSLASESLWTVIGPLVAVLSVAVVTAVLRRHAHPRRLIKRRLALTR